MKLKDLRIRAGLTQEGMSEKLGIPKRTIENWETEKRKCPDYVERLIAEKLEGMAMTKYELKKNYIEVPYGERESIEKGITSSSLDSEPEVIKAFADKESALEALKRCESKVDKLNSSAGTYFGITEYYVEENAYDEDGEWISGGDIWEYSEMKAIKE